MLKYDFKIVIFYFIFTENDVLLYLFKLLEYND